MMLTSDHTCLLSLLAKRMARVAASGSPSLTSAAAFQTQLRSLPTFGESFMSGTTRTSLVSPPHDSSQARLTIVVGADLEGLVSAHDQSGLVVFLVLEQSDIASSTLFPLSAFFVKLEELCAHLERLLLQLFIGLGVDLFREAYDRLKVNVCFLFWCLFIILGRQVSAKRILPIPSRAITSSAAFWALALPLGSSLPSWSSSFFSFLGPPPNMLKTFSFTAVVALAAMAV